MPSSWEFQQLAEASFDAANAAYADCQSRDARHDSGEKDVATTFMSITVVFLYFRAIELALKAAILERQLAPPETIPKKGLGHDIKKLISCATKPTTGTSAFSLKNLGLNTEDKDYIERYSDDYSNKWFEYNFNLWDIPCLKESQRIAGLVLSAIKPVAMTLPSAPL
jgi:hypothetical protein